MRIRKSKVISAEKRVPLPDFIGRNYDEETGIKTNNILFILSTPRSGSTLLSDLIYQNGICLAHEYFQPFQYLPILANRWGCLNGSVLDKEAYIQNLLRYRTSTTGWLGINLHGEHLSVFRDFENLLPDVQRHYIYLVRRDIIAQSVSFEIAMQTAKWSSHFAGLEKPAYSFHGIKKRLDSINAQNALVSAYLKSRNITARAVYYEDLIENANETLSGLIPGTILKMEKLTSNLERQSSNINEDWIDRFSNEYYESSGRGSRPILTLSHHAFCRVSRRLKSMLLPNG